MPTGLQGRQLSEFQILIALHMKRKCPLGCGAALGPLCQGAVPMGCGGNNKPIQQRLAHGGNAQVFNDWCQWLQGGPGGVVLLEKVGNEWERDAHGVACFD